ncbi:MAG TPA: hypothetical protein DCL80_05210 [Balneola sp.]|nr:hypothetical protein [Balneola sp.]MAO77900.1 hypothetical protein [Balneola sp.]MBF63354.1 hypothetical protein [Balneola sp.]HAH50686.1 hypothetical protein [Balneola sp.]HAW81575.1 hypothetical protein [Balneola sp.]|tara:strand:+ start:25826 stop:26314 length:489 start_codon:yes stop_codon:yes gene_type:complete
MIRVEIVSEKYPIENILIHIRVFFKDSKSYGNISNLKTDEFGSILLTDEFLKQSIEPADFNDIFEFGISFLNSTTIEQLKNTYERFETISILEIQNEFIKKGFRENEIEELSISTLSELRKQSKLLPFYELNNNHLVPNLTFQNEFKFSPYNTNVIIDLDSV